MRKLITPLLLVILLSPICFSAATQTNPSDVLSWAVSVKDGTWTVKALGLAGGPEGTEAMSWVVDPQGKILSSATGEIDKSCNGCFMAGQLLMDPVSGLTSTTMQEASKNNKDIAALSQIFTMQTQLKQLGMTEGEVKIEKQKIPGPVTGAVPDTYNIYSMPSIKVKSPTPEESKDVFSSLRLSEAGLSYLDVKAVEGVGVAKPLPPEESKNKDSTFETKNKKDSVKGSLAQGSTIEYNIKEGPKQDTVKTDIVAGDKGTVVKFDKNPPIKVPKDVELKNSPTTCVDKAGKSVDYSKSENNPNVAYCSTSITVEAPINQRLSGTEGTVAVKDPYELELCGNKYTVMSGTKLEIDMKNDGKTSKCTLKPGSEIKYSNAKEFNGASGKGQEFVFDNIKIVADPQKYDHQEGFVKFDGKALEGTIREAEFKDGTKVSVGGDTSRKTMVTDQVKFTLDDKGNFLTASTNAKNRPVYLYSDGVNLFETGFKTKDTFFTVKPVTITAEKDDYRIRTPYNDYILSKAAAKASEEKYGRIVTAKLNLDPEFEKLLKTPASELFAFDTKNNVKVPVDSIVTTTTGIVETDLPPPVGGGQYPESAEPWTNKPATKAVFLADEGQGEVTVLNSKPAPAKPPGTKQKPAESSLKPDEKIAPATSSKLKLPETFTILKPIVSNFYYEDTISNGVDASTKFLQHKAEYVDYPPWEGLFGDNTMIVTKPVDNIGVMFPKTKEGENIYVYRPLSTKSFYTYQEYALTKTTIWTDKEKGKGVTGLLVDQRGNFFKLKEGDLVKDVKSNMKNIIREPNKN
jgi:hypothetical protein